MFDPAVEAARTYFLSRTRMDQRARAAEALDVLLTFSIGLPGALVLAQDDELEQPSIGFDLRSREVACWKAYAREQKVELLTRSHHTLTQDERLEFVRRWRLIKGREHTMVKPREAAMIALSAVAASSAVRSAFLDVMTWAASLGSRVTP